MDAITRIEHMIANERNPRKREEMRKALKDEIRKMELRK